MLYALFEGKLQMVKIILYMKTEQNNTATTYRLD